MKAKWEGEIPLYLKLWKFWECFVINKNVSWYLFWSYQYVILGLLFVRKKANSSLHIQDSFLIILVICTCIYSYILGNEVYSLCSLATFSLKGKETNNAVCKSKKKKVEIAVTIDYKVPKNGFKDLFFFFFVCFFAQNSVKRREMVSSELLFYSIILLMLRFCRWIHKITVILPVEL